MKQRDWLPPLKATLKKIPGIPQLARLIRLIINPTQRNEWLLLRSKPANLFQLSGLTWANRHPREFGFVKERLSDVSAPRILSFGCSTGEEVFSLQEYFPNAEIVGIDINPRSIAVCRKKLVQVRAPHISFSVADSTTAEQSAHYDAIFCLSVLRRGELGATKPASCTHLIRFNDFEKTVTDLCRCLKPGGYFIIIGSNFRFADTEIAAAFHAVFSRTEPLRTDTPLYDRNNHRLPDSPTTDVIFHKRCDNSYV